MKKEYCENIKRAILFIVLFTVITPGYTQCKKKKTELSIDSSIGLLPTYLADGGRMDMLPLNFKAQLWFKNKFSIAAEFGYSTQQVTRVFQAEPIDWINHTSVYTLKFGVHYNKLEPFNIFGGLALGANRIKVESKTIEELKLREIMGIKMDRTHLVYTAFVGGSFQVDQHLFLFMEAGFLNSLLKLGLGYKFKRHSKK